ncbi:AAA family ATPase [Priestia megaterium]|uniref:AAA family ATPase n=1 Tax=Priestia megaterium TaxID=1404 RepID=UPI00366AEDF0
MCKIVIVGNANSGKTTLGKQLHKDLAIPFFELDNVLKHLHTSTFPTRQQIRQQKRELNKIMNKDNWIIEGWGASQTYEDRFNHAKIIIFLDIPSPVRLKRWHKRLEQNKSENISLDLYQTGVEKMHRFDSHVKPMILYFIGKYKDIGDSKLILNLDENFNYEEVLNQINNFNSISE